MLVSGHLSELKLNPLEILKCKDLSWKFYTLNTNLIKLSKKFEILMTNTDLRTTYLSILHEFY